MSSNPDERFTNALKGWAHLTHTLARTLPTAYFNAGNARKRLRALRTGRR